MNAILCDALKKMRIALVDDDPLIRDAMGMFFRNEGCALKTFGDAREAMEELSKEAYDLVICDYRLPGMDGIALFRFLEGTRSGAIRILVSAYGPPDIPGRGSPPVFDAFLQKPLTVEKLESSLQRLIVANRGGGRSDS